MSDNVIIMGESNVSKIEINTDDNDLDKICKTKNSLRELKAYATENIDLTKMDYDDDALEIMNDDNKMDAKSLNANARGDGANKHESDDDVLEIVNLDDDNSDSGIKSEVIDLDDCAESWSTANDLYRNTNIKMNTGKTNQYCASDSYNYDNEPYEIAVNKVHIEEDQPDKLVIRGFTFPNSLYELGFGFNKDGKLCQYDDDKNQLTEKGYEFDIGTPEYNQAHYEAVGEIVTNYVYKLLVGMGYYKIPFKLPESKSTRDTFIFTNRRNLKYTKKLLILIHGSGVVRAGQWARSLIINQSLHHGTQIPYIKEAERLGYDVIITNTNDIRDNSFSPIDHANAVFKKFVIPAKPSTVAIVAHSFGAAVTAAMGRNYNRFFTKKVTAIAFTDGVYKIIPDYNFQKISKNWVSSPLPLNTEIYTSTTDIKRVSAGHIKHEWTSWAAMSAIFTFLEKSYFNFMGNMAETMTTPDITKSKQSSRHTHKRKSRVHRERSASAVPIENVLISDDSDQDISRTEILKEKKRTIELLNQDRSTAAVLNQENLITESSSNQEQSASKLPNQVNPATEQKKSISESSTEDKSSNQDKSTVESSNQDKSTVESSNQEQSDSKLSNQVNPATDKSTVESSNQDKSTVESSNQHKSTVESSNQDKSTVESSNQEQSDSNLSNQVNPATEQKKSITESSTADKSTVESSNQDKSTVESSNQDKSTVELSNQDKSTVDSSNQEQSDSKLSNQVNSTTEQNKSVAQSSTEDKPSAESSNQDKSTAESSNQEQSPNQVNSTTEQNNSVSESTADSSSPDQSTAESSNQEISASNVPNQFNVATGQKQSVAESSNQEKSTVDSSSQDKSTAESTSNTSADLDMEIDANAFD